MENVVFYKQKERKKEGESEVRQRIRIHKAETNKGAADFSHLLDAPAGKHGFVRVKDGHFYFEDGTRIRFLASIWQQDPILRIMRQRKNWLQDLPVWV